MAISFSQVQALLRNIGVVPDMELVSLCLQLMSAAQNAPDRQRYLKDALRRAVDDRPRAEVLQGRFDDD